MIDARAAGRRALLALTGVAAMIAAGCGPSGVRFHQERIPDRLSDWGVVQVESGQLALAEGVVPYELNTALFTDYAHKLRTVWMPEGAQATVAESGKLALPVGTVLSKTFYYPRAGEGEGEGVIRVERSLQPDLELRGGGLDLSGVVLMETRLLVHREEGWITLPYVWNEAQTEATLRIVGDETRLELVSSDGASEPFLYVVPDANQCSGCHVTDHASKRPEPIGPALRHLNREVNRAGERRSQLELWVEAGHLPADVAETTERAAAAFDPSSGSLEERARAYLDINCAHCHSATGPADTSGLFLDAATEDHRRLGACKPPIAAGRGSGDRLVSIFPGRPEESIMPFRMDSTDPGIAMPELGRSTVDHQGVALIAEWIRSLPGECEPALATAPKALSAGP